MSVRDTMLYRGKSLRAELQGDGIVNLCFDRECESVNKFDARTVAELRDATEAIATSGAVRGVLVTSGKQAFIVGADIFEFTATFAQSEPAIRAHVARQNQAFTAFDDLPVPSVALINGLALGGGFEMALACDARVMSTQAGVGLPEVTLGLFPGFGGTVRLSRLIGVAAAIDWIISGRQQDAAKALASRAVDEIIPPEELIAAGRARLSKLIESGEWRDSRRRRHGPVAADTATFEAARKGLKRISALQPAALAAVEMLQRAAPLDRDAALALETETFARIARTQAAASMIQLFIDGQLVQKRAREYSKSAPPVRRAAVLGAGIMGGGIAFTSASRGIPVVMKDIAQEQLDSGSKEVDRLLARQVEAKRISQVQARAVRESIQPTLNFESFGNVDMVVEAIVENPGVKKRVLAEVEARVGTETVLASNTSSLSISEMATALRSPGRFVGLHFFNPVPAMPLVEVIRGTATDGKFLAVAVAFASTLGKTPIVVRDCPGFLVNRILTPYMLGFLRAVADGADFEQVDRVMEGFGWPMGPAFLQDVIGMDTLEHVLAVICAGYPERMTIDFPNAVKTFVKRGRLGQKSGSGWYRYEPDQQGKRRKVSDPTAKELLAASRSPAGSISNEAILDRILLPMVLEAALCLQEGVTETAAEIDLSLVLGLGFPRHAGGALKYADWLGAAQIVRRCETLASLGPLYQPCRLLRELASTGGLFHPLEKSA